MAYVIILAIIIAILLVVAILRSNSKPATQVMLLGIEITLVGGILAIDANTNLGGIEYLIVFIGLVVTIIGFGKKAQMES